MNSPTLVIIRGNSGSGKTTAAREVRHRFGRGCALIELDHVRRVILREHHSDRMPTVAPTLIVTMAKAVLAEGYHLVLEGHMPTGRYGTPLRELVGGQRGPSFVYWLDVSLEETVRRHHARAEPIGVTAEQMSAGYAPMDLLGVPGERVIPERSGFEETVGEILHGSGLAGAAALTPCPVLCPRCREKRGSTG